MFANTGVLHELNSFSKYYLQILSPNWGLFHKPLCVVIYGQNLALNYGHFPIYAKNYGQNLAVLMNSHFTDL